MRIREKRRILFLTFLFFIPWLSLFFQEPHSLAWNRHNLMTDVSLEEMTWLDKFENIRAISYSYEDNSLNPAFEIVYENPDPLQAFPPPSRFVYIDVDTKIRYDFRGAPLNKSTSARDILRNYSDEPDWGMDKGLELKFAQNLMGGSQGYRHMYYPGGSIHLPNIILPQGDAPNRTKHFYQLAKTAFMNGDLYWGFRFLARALHYIQDLAQPYHTTQTSLSFINLSDLIGGTIQTTKNYHFAFENYVAQVLVLEKAGLKKEDYMVALRQGSVKPTTSPEKLAIETATSTNSMAGKFLKTNIKFFGNKYKTTQRTELNQADFNNLMEKESGTEFNRVTKKFLKQFSQSTKSFLEFARKDIPELSKQK